MEEIKYKIDHLRSELNRHNHSYYVLNNPTIEDQEFDQLMKELELLESTYPEFMDPNSPTKRVGSDLLTSFKAVDHLFPMLSLSNSYSKEELIEFDNRIKKDYSGDVSYCCELKFDGASISLAYENGVLKQALTRGDGVKGDDVTSNIKTVRSLPLDLGTDFSGTIRGEVVMSYSQFERLNEERKRVGKMVFANPRNATSGSLKLQQSSVVAKRGLDLYLYYTPDGFEELDSHYDKLNKIKSLGFKVSNDMERCKDIESVINYIERWDRERVDLPVAIDGIVIKVDSVSAQEDLGYTSKSPRWAIAYKFKAEQQRSKLLEVTYQVGRTGAITPVANIEPVALSGTVVRRASLHNADIISQLGIYEGDTLLVEKGGEIIPKIVGVESENRDLFSRPIEFISNCPECGGELKRSEGESAFYCVNSDSCPPQIKGAIEHFVSRGAMNIDSLGRETIKVLYDEDILNNIADIYDLGENLKWKEIPLIGDKTVSNISKAVEESKKQPFSKVLFAIGIRHVGATTAKLIVKEMLSLKRLKTASVEELVKIDGIGNKVASSIVDFFQEGSNCEIVDRLEAAGVQFEEQAVEIINDCLKGLKFVVSGNFGSSQRRKDLSEMVVNHGGKVVSGVTKNLDYLLAGDKVGPSKLTKAEALGISIIDEESFISMINPDKPAVENSEVKIESKSSQLILDF